MTGTRIYALYCITSTLVGMGRSTSISNFYYVSGKVEVVNMWLEKVKSENKLTLLSKSSLPIDGIQSSNIIRIKVFIKGDKLMDVYSKWET